jgi:hypothetical protein
VPSVKSSISLTAPFRRSSDFGVEVVEEVLPGNSDHELFDSLLQGLAAFRGRLGDRIEQDGGVFHGARDRAGMIERKRKWDDPGGAHQAIRRFQSDYSAQGRRFADGPCGVGADCAVAHA